MRCPVDNRECHRETEERCPTKMANGQNACTLGDTSIPVKTGSGFTVYELIPVEGGIRVRLSRTHRSYLVLLSERGGETDFDYGKVDPEVRVHLYELFKMKLIEEIIIIGRSAVKHRLTDMGRNIVTMILKSGGQ